MKKLIISAVLIASAATFAALDFRGVNTTAVMPTASIDANATNTTVFATSPMKGISELCVTANAAANRTLMEVTLYATNTVAGGWSIFATTSSTNATAGVIRLPFPGEYMPQHAKLEISSLGAASTVSALLLSY